MTAICQGKRFPLDFDELERDVVLTDQMLICGLDTGIDTWVSVGSLTKPERIDFTSATPGLLNYRTAIIPLTTLTYLARFGDYPKARMFWIDENNEWQEWIQSPKFTISGGLIQGFVWDLGQQLTGFIIISRS